MVWCLCGKSLPYPYDPNMPVIKSLFMKLVQQLFSEIPTMSTKEKGGFKTGIGAQVRRKPLAGSRGMLPWEKLLQAYALMP